MIGVAIHGLSGGILGIQEKLGGTLVGLGTLLGVEISHDHRRKVTKLGDLIQNDRNTLDTGLVADMVKVRIEDHEVLVGGDLRQDHITADAVVSSAPILAHDLRGLGQPEGTLVLQGIKRLVIENGAALGNDGIIPVVDDGIITRQHIHHVIILPAGGLLEADDAGLLGGNVRKQQVCPVEPGFLAQVQGRQAAKVAAHHGDIFRLGGDGHRFFPGKEAWEIPAKEGDGHK